MAVNPSPWGPCPQIELADGTPAVGGRLFAYVAGSVGTKQNTYSDSTGLVANTNPLVLNSLGMLTTEWWWTAGQSYKIVYAGPGSDDPPTSPIKTWDHLSGQNDVATALDQWVSGPAPTYVGVTSFTLVGDQTSAFHVGRRLKTTNSGGTIYSTIATSVYGVLTTVTVVNDSGTLDSGLSAVNYGLLSATNPSTPLLTDAFPIVSGSADKTKRLRVEVDGFTTATTRIQTPPDYDHRVMSQTHGADIASATGAGTLNLDTATGDLIDVTGTTGISAVTLAEGKMAMVRFTGALLLTHGASHVLPGALNITTAAGDVAIYRGYAAGVVRCVNYQPIAPGPIAGETKLASGSVSAATLDIVMTSYTAFANKRLVFDLIPATDSVTLFARVSTDGGSTYDAGAGAYSYMAAGEDDNAASLAAGGTDTGMRLSAATNVGNGAGEGISGELRMFNTTSTAKWPRFSYQTTWISSDATPRGSMQSGGGARRAAQDTDAFQLLFGAGNIVGTWALYGSN